MKNKFIVKIEVITMLIIDRMFLFNREVSYNLKEKNHTDVSNYIKKRSKLHYSNFFFKLQI